jgi:4-hydroxythreonine-4-phosphate dehydrogenase
MMVKKAPIVITMGDASGIGPEIIVRAFRRQPALMQTCFVAGDVQTLRRAASVERPAHALPIPIAVIHTPEQTQTIPPNCIPGLQVGESLPVLPWGRVNALSGSYAGSCVVWAAQAALGNKVAAMVTAPLHKEALHAGGAPWTQFPGHTEILQAVTAEFLQQNKNDVPVRMMLASDELRTVLLSIHVSLRQAIEVVTLDNILQTLEITHKSLHKMLGRTPRIAVAALNPHAGESGLFGSEELEQIAPAIDAARKRGYDVSGPWAPDTVFMRARNTPQRHGEFDVVVAMYHDQGLIPVKYLGVDKGVNVTLGLPFVRTSPDHGTAFDIAGTGKADASSFIEAVSLAKQLAVSN